MRWRTKLEVARPGKVIAGRYRLAAPLDSGGMGTIWSAEHVRLRSRVAIKFLDASIADDPEMLERFLREAQSAAAVRSSHVVQIFDCGVDGVEPYIAMELLQGESLLERLAIQGRLTPAELNKIFSEVATAVGNAHQLGVVHRDLKPGNIFLAREGELEITKVLDFGVAKVMNQSLQLATGTGTRTGTLLGTPNYMSPEQARGSRSLDQSTDLWSLAIIAFECLTGQHAFAGETIGEVVVQICTEAPHVPSCLADVPAGFDEWFLKAASKSPAERFRSAREMAETLSEILTRGAPATQSLGGGAASPSEPATLHSGSAEPRVPTCVASSPSLSPAQLARARETEPPSSLFGTLLRTASEGLHWLGLSAPPAWFRPLGPWLAPLSLVCGVCAIALWYGAGRRAPADSSRESARAPVAAGAAAPPAREAFELQAPAPLEAEPGAGESLRGSAPPSRLAEPTLQRDAPPAGVRVRRSASAPDTPAKVSAANTVAANASAVNASVAKDRVAKDRVVKDRVTKDRVTKELPSAETPAPPSPINPTPAPAPNPAVVDPFADRL